MYCMMSKSKCKYSGVKGQRIGHGKKVRQACKPKGKGRQSKQTKDGNGSDEEDEEMESNSGAGCRRCVTKWREKLPER